MSINCPTIEYVKSTYSVVKVRQMTITERLAEIQKMAWNNSREHVGFKILRQTKTEASVIAQFPGITVVQYWIYKDGTWYLKPGK